MIQLRNASKPFWVVQIDLSSAYNSVNLYFLEQLIRKQGFWSEEEQQLWRFLATNSRTFFEGLEVQEINGLAQGSLLSPMLFNLYLNELLVGSRSKKMFVLAYADDLIGITEDKIDLVKFIRQTKDFFRCRQLRLNADKSDVLSFGRAAGCSEVEGITVRVSAKYLGVSYNRSLSIEYSLQAFSKKIFYVYHRLYRLLKASDFRLRYNLWQVFIAPLFRMTLSMVGEPGSNRARSCYNVIRKHVRSSLKKFTLAPKCSDPSFFEELGQTSDSILDSILERAKKMAEERTEKQESQHLEFALQETQNSDLKHWKGFHPNIDLILRIINCCRCRLHPDAVLSIRHLQQHHQLQKGRWDQAALLASPTKNSIFQPLLPLLWELKGTPLWPSSSMTP